MISYNYDPDKHYIMLIVNDMKSVFGLPRTEYVLTKRIKPLHTFEPYDNEKHIEYKEYVKRYYYFWDFFGLSCTNKNLGVYEGVLYSFGEFNLKPEWNQYCITKHLDKKIYNNEYLKYKNDILKYIEVKIDKRVYRINVVAKISLLIKKYNKDKVFYITYMNNRLIDLFKLI